MLSTLILSEIKSIVRITNSSDRFQKIFGIFGPSGKLVGEFLSEGNLSDFISLRRNYEWKVVWRLSLDISDGMNYLHSMKLVNGDCVCHNNLCGGNIILYNDINGIRAKIAGFGSNCKNTEENLYFTDIVLNFYHSKIDLIKKICGSSFITSVDLFIIQERAAPYTPPETVDPNVSRCY